MSSTFTKYAYLEKHEDRSVGWNLGTNLDTVDQGLNVHVMTNGAGSDVTAFAPVKLHASTSNVFNVVEPATGPAFGLLLSTVADGATGQVLTRGFAENNSWAWSVGDVLYLSGSTIGKRTDLMHVAQSGDSLFMQPVGIATSAIRAWFNFERWGIMPYTLPAVGYVVSAGSATESFKAITGPGNAHVLTSSSATVIYTFVLPGWFKAIPNISGIWGFRIRYIAAATGTIDVGTMYDGQNHSGDPGISAGTSTTWANLDVNWNQIAGISGWAPAATGSIHVAVTVATASVDFEVMPRLRFEPSPTMFG